MSARQNPYVGKAGHLAAMAEFLLRGWNTAIPEVDIGDDIYVVEDGDGTLIRVQVKTAHAKWHKSGKTYGCTFALRADQVQADAVTPLYYVFMVRIVDPTKALDQWDAPLIVPREDLKEEITASGKKPNKKGSYSIYFTHTAGEVNWGARDMTKYIKD